ncbi:MAG: hypothetical protein JXR48_11980 [Candidatus Delongbacteria bacterium]|nr:hypothetical protein [Candidatus Delongbacteria bacterium]MBN2835671.1 hypothetical protein [Candidatus Delongbacteria bacterium]
MEIHEILEIDEKVVSLIGFAMKSGKVTIGTNRLTFSKPSDFGIVIIHTELSENSLKKIKKHFSGSDTILYLYKNEPGTLIHRSGIQVLGIKKSDFISGIMKNLTVREITT